MPRKPAGFDRPDVTTINVEHPESEEQPEPMSNDADPRNTFAIFPDGLGHWCARRFDGLVNGTFVDRETAIRFVRREARHNRNVVYFA